MSIVAKQVVSRMRVLMGNHQVGLNDEDALEFSKKTVFRWMCKVAKISPDLVPDMPEEGQFIGRFARIEVASTEGIWSAKVAHYDRNRDAHREGRLWTTDVSLTNAGNQPPILSYRLHTTNVSPEQVDQVRSIPRFIREISSELGLFDAKEELLPDARELETAKDFEDLCTFLENPLRRRPVMLFIAPPSGEPYPIDPDEFADNVFGLAHVYEVPERMVDALSDRIYHALYPGSVVTFGNDYDPMTGMNGTVRMATRRSLMEDPTVASTLVRSCFRGSVSSIMEWDAFPTVDIVRSQALEARPMSMRV